MENHLDTFWKRKYIDWCEVQNDWEIRTIYKFICLQIIFVRFYSNNFANMSKFIKISFIECTDTLLIFYCRSVFCYTEREINCYIVTILKTRENIYKKLFSSNKCCKNFFISIVEKCFWGENFLPHASRDWKSWIRVKKVIWSFPPFLPRKKEREESSSGSKFMSH